MLPNIFIERVEKFNNESERTAVIEALKEEAEREANWETVSVADMQKLFNLTEKEAKLFFKSGVFKTYRVGNEYRALKKSVDEKMKTINAVTSYRDKKTMSVMDLKRLLGLGKTAAYRLINQCHFKTYLVLGTMRVDVDSFEEWYAGQFHYVKVNGEKPGKNYVNTIAPISMAKVLGISKSTAYDLMNNNEVEVILVNGKRRVVRKSFEDWLKVQDRYQIVKTLEEVEGYVD